jgi:hypothetical protein
MRCPEVRSAMTGACRSVGSQEASYGGASLIDLLIAGLRPAVDE